MFKKIVIYGIGTFVSKILVFFLIPIYTREIAPASYGYYDVLTTNMQMLASIAFIEIWSGALRFMLLPGKENNKLVVVKAILIMLIPLTVLYGTGCWLMSNFITIKYPVLTLIFGFSFTVFNIANSMCRGLGRNILYITSGFTSTLISCSLGLFFIVYMHYDVRYLLIASTIGYVIAIIFVEIKTKVIRNSLQEKMDWPLLKKMAWFCVPLLVNSIAFSFLGTFNKTLIISKLGEISSGYYAVACKFSSIFAILISIYELALQEQLYLTSNDKEKASIYSYHVNSFIKFVGLAVPICIFVVYLAFPIVIGNNYINARPLIPMAILSTYVSTVSGVLGNVLGAETRTELVMYSTLPGAFLNIGLNLAMIKILGVQSANISLFVSFLLIALIRYKTVHNIFNLTINRRIILLILIECILCWYIVSIGNLTAIYSGLFMALVIWAYSNGEIITQILYKIKKIMQQKI